MGDNNIKEDNYYDVVISGLGASGILTSYNLIDKLYTHFYNHNGAGESEFVQNFCQQYPPDKPLKIMLADKYGAIGGLAYNPDLSPPPLLLHNSIATIHPSPLAQIWLAHNKDQIIEYLERQPNMSQWLGEHQEHLQEIEQDIKIHDDVDTDIWDSQLEKGKYTQSIKNLSDECKEMRLPRAVYGMFLDFLFERQMEMISEMQEGGVNIDIDIVRGEIAPESIQSAGGEIVDNEDEQKDAEEVAQKQDLQFEFKQSEENTNPGSQLLKWQKGENDVFGKLLPQNEFTKILPSNITTGQLGYFAGASQPRNFDELEGQEGYYNNMYYHEPGADGGNRFSQLYDEVKKQASDRDAGNPLELVIIGSKASAADHWIMIYYDNELRNMVEDGKLKLTHISSTGEQSIRHGAIIGKEYTNENFALFVGGNYNQELDLQKIAEHNNADGLLALYQAATSDAIKQGFTFYDASKIIKPMIDKILQSNPKLKKSWYGINPEDYDDNWSKVPAAKYAEMNFLTAKETIDAYDFLKDNDAVSFKNGRLDRVQTELQDGKWQVAYNPTNNSPTNNSDDSNEQEQAASNDNNPPTISADIIVNAAGFESVGQSTNYKPLIENKIFQTNEYGWLDYNQHSMSASDLYNIYIMGINARGSFKPGMDDERIPVGGAQLMLSTFATKISDAMLGELGLKQGKFQQSASQRGSSWAVGV